MYEVCLKAEDSVLEAEVEEEEASEDGEGGIKQRGVGAMVKIFHFVMKQSYICALIAMMVSTDEQLTSSAAAACIPASSAGKLTNQKKPLGHPLFFFFLSQKCSLISSQSVFIVALQPKPE